MQPAKSDRRAWPVGATIFTLALAFAFAGYALDVTAKARGATDWMMILPAAGIGLLALAASLIEDWREAARSPEPEIAPEDRVQTRNALVFMGVLAAYVMAIPYAGFDVATFVFLATALLVQGERRPLVVAGFALLTTLAVVWAFVSLLAVSLPTRLF